MTLYDFNILREADQYNELSKHGVMIAELMEEEYKIFLYQIHSFYVELYYNRVDKRVKRLVSFSSTDSLEVYLDQIEIDDLLVSRNSIE
jgi:hypothetical protein